MNFLQKVVIGALWLMTAVLASAPSADATIYFYEDFEGSQASINSRWSAGTNCPGDIFRSDVNPSISSIRAFGGTKSLRHIYNGHQPDHINSGYTAGPMGSTQWGGCITDAEWQPKISDAWYTWYEYWDAGFIIDEIGTKTVKQGDLNKANHWATYMWGPYPEGPPFFFTNGCCSNLIGRNNLTFHCQNCKNGQTPLGQTWASGSTRIYYPNTGSFVVPDNKWVCNENHIKYNSSGQANGMIEMFQTNKTDNGSAVQTHGYYNLELRGANTNDPVPSDAGFNLWRSYIQDGKGTMYRDNLTVSDTRVGCGGTPPPPDTTAPPQVTVVNGTVVSSTQINWSWTGVSDPSGVTYNLEVSVGLNNTTYTVLASNYNGTSYNHTGLLSNTIYNLRIRPTDGAGNLQQTWSPVLSRTTQAAPSDTTAPPVISSISGSVQSSTGINWNWSGVSDPSGVTYRLEGSTGTGNVTYTLIANNLTSPSYNETGLDPATVYNRRVRPTDGAGNVQQTWSPIATATTQTVPTGTAPDQQEDICTQSWVLFCDNFNSRALGIGDRARATYKNSGWAHSGNNHKISDIGNRRLMEMVFTPGTGASSSGFADTSFRDATGVQVSAPEIYIRFMTYWTPNFVFGASGNNGFKFGQLDHANNHIWARTYNFDHIGIVHGTTPTPWAPSPGPGVNDYYKLNPSGVFLNTGQWYCMETHVKNNTTTSSFDGTVQAWIDGTEVMNFNNMLNLNNLQSNASLRQFGHLEIATDRDTSDANGVPINFPAQSRYYDDIVVGTQRINCPGAQLSDTTPPPVPTITSVTTSTYTAIVNIGTVVDNSGGTVSYSVERSLPNCTGYSTDPPASIGVTTSSTMTDLGLSQNTTYCWRVKATDPTGNQSAFSTQVQATTQLPSNLGGLGIASGQFTLGGVPTFIASFSYFDAMNWHASDIDTMAARGWNGARIFVDWANDDGTPGDRSVCSATGTIQSGQAATVSALLDYLEGKGMVATIVILNEVSDLWMTSDSARQTCVVNVVNLFKSRLRVKFDVVQEFDYSFTGVPATSLTPAQVGAYNALAKAACPTCIIYSSASSPLTHPQDLTATIVGSAITDMTNNSQDVIAIHDYRSSNWWSITGARVTAYRSHLISINKANVPVIFDEPNRYGFTYSSSEAEFNQAARDAKNAGAAEWTFHTGANFEMGASSMMSQLQPTETAITISLVGALTEGSGNEVPEIVGSDTFTRADTAELGADWEFGTEYNALQILGNQIRPLNTVVGSLERYIGTVLPNNQGIRGKLSTSTGSSLQHLRLNVRLDPFPNYNGMYCAFNRNGTPVVSIVKRVLGQPTVLASSNTPNLAQDDILACEGYGSLYRALQNGIEILQVSDGTYTAGAPGVYMSTDGAVADFGFDNVEAYRFTAAVPLSLMASVVTDANGADLTFTAPAYKIRYWNNNNPSETPIEISGLGGVSSYRHNITHALNVSFQCYQSQGANEVWETDTWICAGVTPGDTVAPSKPQILSIE